MAEIGYVLSSEEQDPRDLIKNAQKAEEAGFSYLSISDHYFPWTEKQGQSNFVWATLGAISQVTKHVGIITGVTCPTMRYHPAILAQATATVALLFEDRFSFGVGTGENLNEHIIAAGWPEVEIRQAMLKEALEIIRLLWEGNMVSYYGDYYSVENAKIYTHPQKSPPIIFSALGTDSAELAGELGDAFITTKPKREIIDIFHNSGGKGKPIYGEFSVCFTKTEEEGEKFVKAQWPIAGLEGDYQQELRLPKYFEQVTKDVTPEKLGQSVVCGSDPKKYVEGIQQYIDAGFTHVHIHNIGVEQDGFFEFYQKTLAPMLK